MIRPIFGDIARKAVVTFVLAGVACTLASLFLGRAVKVWPQVCSRRPSPTTGVLCASCCARTRS
jgi:hypothetical protein